VPAGWPSMRVAGMMPPAWEVIATAVARRRSLALSRPLLHVVAGFGGKLDQRSAGDAGWCAAG
jgi:hypothetical protein